MSEEKYLACAFGEPWVGPHPKCDQATIEACEQFDADVRAGKYDTEGFTPTERKTQQRRAREAGRLF